MVGDGKSRSLDVNSVGMRNYRLKKSGKTIPVTVADFIRQQGAALVEYNPAQPLPVSGCLYVTTRSQSGLPASIGRLSFVVGSRPVTLTVNNRTQHSFDFTTDAATATVGCTSREAWSTGTRPARPSDTQTPHQGSEAQ
eukprot:gene7125-biopygen4386